MLQLGDEVTLYSVVFVVVLLGTRSPVWTTVLTASLYLFLGLFRFPQVPAGRVQRVLHPANAAAGSAKVSVVAHRGGGHDAPENTIAAIREASKNGATGVELDLEFSADGVPILMHDETVDRTTNGTGPLSQMRFSDLRKLDASAKHRLREKFVGEKIPTLEEAVEECIKLQLTIYFDVKGHPDEMRQSDPEVVTALTHRPWHLSRFGDGAPRFSSPLKHHWMTLMDIVLDSALHHILWKLCGISALLIQKNFVSPDYVHYWAQRGVHVVAWTVNTKVEKEYYEELLQVNYITDSLVEDCEPHY
ncbi:glycerophosphodiester phosphodiesterase 1 isoform X2 [Echeneis naucrates]|uniref:glycerophosphodiester phosphodiesterase 1 isoform X2 n=1 Tax=Echeneis naucrates TaxID=173247 RepID=UPI001114670B|nr:glycerophosphodiester phosphodiesterase 1-like isoform X2 [Echeneis naucrates]